MNESNEVAELLDRIPEGILLVDQEGLIVRANDAACDILNLPRDSVEGYNCLRVLEHPSAEHLATLLSDAAPKGLHDLYFREGSRDSLSVVSAAVRAFDATRYLITFRDVTAERTIEVELQQTKEFFENLIQSSVDAIVAADMAGTVILFNRGAEQVLGYRASEVVGTLNVREIYRPGDAEDIMRRLRSEDEGGVGRLMTTRKELTSATGESVPVNLTAATISDDKGVIATFGIFTDLRERIRMERRLKRAEDALKRNERQSIAVELAGAAAHELNQPLTSILGYTEILKRRASNNLELQKPLETILRETDRMAAIVRKLGEITSYKTRGYVGEARIIKLTDENSEVSEVPKRE